MTPTSAAAFVTQISVKSAWRVLYCVTYVSHPDVGAGYLSLFVILGLTLTGWRHLPYISIQAREAVLRTCHATPAKSNLLTTARRQNRQTHACAVTTPAAGIYAS